MTTYHDDLRRAAAARPDTECAVCGAMAETITVWRAVHPGRQVCQACLGMADPEWRRLVTEGRSGE